MFPQCLARQSVAFCGVRFALFIWIPCIDSLIPQMAVHAFKKNIAQHCNVYNAYFTNGHKNYYHLTDTGIRQSVFPNVCRKSCCCGHYLILLQIFLPVGWKQAEACYFGVFCMDISLILVCLGIISVTPLQNFAAHDKNRHTHRF